MKKDYLVVLDRYGRGEEQREVKAQNAAQAARSCMSVDATLITVYEKVASFNIKRDIIEAP